MAKRIVKGNDFVMRIPVRKVVKGERVRFPLPACTDIAVNLVNAYRRRSCEWKISVADDSVLEARVEGDKIPLGTYALEVKGKLFGNDWRSSEYEQVVIVDNNAEADADLSGTDENEPSVEMDTAVIIQTAIESVPLATHEDAGAVIVGDGLDVDNGVISAKVKDVTVNGESVVDGDGTAKVEVPEVPVATAEKAGVVKIGDNITVTEDGTISAEGKVKGVTVNGENVVGEDGVAEVTANLVNGTGVHSLTTLGGTVSGHGSLGLFTSNVFVTSSSYTKTDESGNCSTIKIDGFFKVPDGEIKVADLLYKGFYKEEPSLDSPVLKEPDYLVTSCKCKSFTVYFTLDRKYEELANTGQIYYVKIKTEGTASGSQSIAIGGTASGSQSIAIGGTASGDREVVLGSYRSQYSFLGGSAKGSNSFALYGRASGLHSMVFGRPLDDGYGLTPEAKNPGEVVFGCGNISRADTGTYDDTVFVIGNGRDISQHGTGVAHNAFEVRRNGDIYIPDPSWSGDDYWKRPMVKFGEQIPKSVENSIVTDNATETLSLKVTGSDEEPSALRIMYQKGDEDMAMMAVAVSIEDDMSRRAKVICVDKEGFLTVSSSGINIEGGSPTKCFTTDGGVHEFIPASTNKSLFVNSPGEVTLSVDNEEKTYSGGSSFTVCPQSGILVKNIPNGTRLKVMGKLNTNAFAFVKDGSHIASLDVRKWDTSSATSFNAMFSGCSSLTSLDVSGFDTSSATSFNTMFRGCSALASLDVSGFDTSKVTNMGMMFSGCSSLTSLDVSGFDTSSATSFNAMFRGCSALASLTFGEGFGKMQDAVKTLDLSALSAWTDDTVKTLLTLYDRKTNGMGVITIKLHANTKAVLGEEGIAQLTAKGYTIA